MTSVAGGFAQGLSGGLNAGAARRDASTGRALQARQLGITEDANKAKIEQQLRTEALGQVKELKAELASAVQGGNLDGAVTSVEQLLNSGVLDGLAQKAGVPLESIVNTLNLAVTPQQRGAAEGGALGAKLDASLPAEERKARMLADVEVDKKVAEVDALAPLNAEAARMKQEALTPGFVERERQVAEKKAEIEAAQKRLEAPKLSDVKGLRGDYTTLSGDFTTIRDSFNRIQALPTDSPAGQIGMVFSIMKMFDPNSVVRESEFATAQNAAGVPDRFRNAFNKLKSGVGLGPEQVKDFKKVAESLFADAQAKQKGLEERFRAIAVRSNMNPDDILVLDTGNASAPRATVPQPPPDRDASFQKRETVGGQTFNIFQDKATGKFFGVPVDG